ncbi:MAG: nickel-binding protein [Acidimicrobiia bacterium]
MPMFMDVHDDLGDATPEDVAADHARDLQVQKKYGVHYLTYWLNDSDGRVFCLVDAPSIEAAVACHEEAHGLVPGNVIGVMPSSVGQFMGDWEASVPSRATVVGAGSEPDSGLRAIMFTDLEASTDVSVNRGDDAAMAVIHAHNEIVRDALAAHGGREVKHTGDGLMASFVSVSRAVECAISIQRKTVEVAKEHPSRAARVRVGLSAGEPVTEHEDLFGATVNLAARICGYAIPSQILVSNTVRDLAIGKGFPFTDRGPIDLKGFPEPIRLFEVSWEQEG